MSNLRSRKWLTLGLMIALPFLIAFGIPPLDTHAAPLLLPPRPSESPPPPPEPKDPPERLGRTDFGNASKDLSDRQERSDPANAYIEVRFPLGSRQKIWTVIQRQIDGSWRDIADWSGEPDSITNGVGRKISLVFAPRFGWGPLRAVIYESEGGRMIGESVTFNAPTVNNQTVTVDVTAAP